MVRPHAVCTHNHQPWCILVFPCLTRQPQIQSLQQHQATTKAELTTMSSNHKVFYNSRTNFATMIKRTIPLRRNPVPAKFAHKSSASLTNMVCRCGALPRTYASRHHDHGSNRNTALYAHCLVYFSCHTTIQSTKFEYSFVLKVSRHVSTH